MILHINETILKYIHHTPSARKQPLKAVSQNTNKNNKKLYSKNNSSKTFHFSLAGADRLDKGVEWKQQQTQKEKKYTTKDIN